MPMVHHLAAKSLLKDWEAGEGVKQLKTPAKEAIIKLSIDSSVVSAHTAYVAVDEDQDKPIEGAIQTWDVTAMMAQQEMGRHGYRFGGGGATNVHKKRKLGGKAKGRSRVAFYGSPQPAMGASFSASMLDLCPKPPIATGTMGGPLPPPPTPVTLPPFTAMARMMPASRSARNVPSEDVVEYAPESSRRRVTRAPSDKLSALISLQQAEGLWKLDASLAGVLSKRLPELEGACPVGCQGDVRQVWATVLALAYLEACPSGQREEWELVAMKAEFWLEGQSLPAGTTLQALREAAKKTV